MDTLFSCVIADDEPAIVSNLKCASFWKTLGISIIAECSNGELAYQAIQNLKPDFAVIDIRMPLLTGLEVLRKCRENGSSTQILIISGFDDFSYAKQALKYGAKAYVLKPIDFTELAEELQHLILTLEHERKVINQSFSATTFFTDLIEGRIIDSSIIRRMLPSLETELTDTACYTVIFSFAAELSNEQYKQVIPLLDSGLTHIRHRFWFKNAKSLVGILNVSDKTPFEVVHALLDSFDSKGYNSVIAGIGDVVPGLYQSTYSYGTAQTALTYRIYNSKERVFSSLHICTDAPPSNENPLHKVDMIKALMTLNKETVSICIRVFLDAVLYVPTPSPTYLYSLSNAFIANTSAG
ncbi:MAG: response regulator, partial [Treponema sp.]|nr:response regulator [Treponema sp.]